MTGCRRTFPTIQTSIQNVLYVDMYSALVSILRMGSDLFRQGK